MRNCVGAGGKQGVAVYAQKMDFQTYPPVNQEGCTIGGPFRLWDGRTDLFNSWDVMGKWGKRKCLQVMSGGAWIPTFLAFTIGLFCASIAAFLGSVNGFKVKTVLARVAQNSSLILGIS